MTWICPSGSKSRHRYDDAKFQGFSADNILNRLATSGIQLEQSLEAREFRAQIACAVANVFASHLRFLIFVQNLKGKRTDAEAQLARSLSKDLLPTRSTSRAQLRNTKRGAQQMTHWRRRFKPLRRCGRSLKL